MSTTIEHFVNIEMAIVIVGLIGMAIIAVMAYIGMENRDAR